MTNSILNTGLIRLASLRIFPQHHPGERMSSSGGGKYAQGKKGSATCI